MAVKWILFPLAIAALLLQAAHSTAFSLPVDEIEKELDALKEFKVGNGSRSASASFSSETKLVDVDGHRQEQAKFRHLETTNGKVLKNIEGLLERETDKNKEEVATKDAARSVLLHAASATDEKNKNNNHTHLRLHVDLPAKNIHQTYDNLDGDVNLSRAMQRVPLDVLRHQLSKKSGLGVNEDLQQVLEEEFERDLEEQVQKELAKEMQVELEKEWEAELDQEMVARQKREEELLRVIFVTTRVLFSYLSREQQDAALQSIGLQMNRLQEQEALHASTQAKASEMIVSSLVEDLNETEAGLPPSYLALIGSRAMTSLTGKN